jgi:hypothetical protein
MRSHDRTIARVHQRCFSRCKTVNQANALHIGLENRITPAERAVLIETLDTMLRREAPLRRFLSLRHQWLIRRPVEYSQLQTARAWLRHFRYHRELSGAGGGVGYQRTGLAQQGYFYRDTSGPNTELLVGWPGLMNRLMMPVANWLPTLERHGMDLLLLRRPRARDYGTQLAWNQNSVSRAHEAVATLNDRYGFESVAVVGTSLGSTPAMQYAAEAGLSRVSIIGLLEQEISQWPRPARRLAAGSHEVSEGIGNVGPFFTYGQDSEGDHAAASHAAKLFVGTAVGVPDAGHAPIWTLFKSRQFDSWFSRTLG